MQTQFIDTLIRIQNGFMAHRLSVKVNNNKKAIAIISALMHLGLVNSYQSDESKNFLIVSLKYKYNRSVFKSVHIISTPVTEFFGLIIN